MADNFHPIRDDGDVVYCLTGSCDRCSDFEFLVRRAHREFGCVLVRPNVTPEPERIDNDDYNPEQPTYREDNELFTLICDLRAQNGTLQQEIEELKSQELNESMGYVVFICFSGMNVDMHSTLACRV